MSVTVTVNEQVLTRPFASTTMYVAVVIPRLNVRVPMLWIPVVGDAAIVAPLSNQVSCAIPQLSLVIGFGVTTDAVHVPLATLAEMLAGQVMLGTVVSTRLTLNVHDAVFPLASATVNVTTVVPTPDTAVPAAGDCVTVNEPAAVQLSARVANER